MRYLLLALGLLTFVILPAQSDADILFDQARPLVMTIRISLDSLNRDRLTASPPDRDATLLIEHPGGRDQLSAEISVRGNYRKSPEHCAWPPLKIKIHKSDMGSQAMGLHRRLKLVTTCQEESFLLKEYLVYRMYEQLSLLSFRVRLVDLTLKDDNGEEFRQMAFLIEDKEEFAHRMQLAYLPQAQLSPDKLAQAQRHCLYLFQYMIGNRDWDIYTEKNVAVFHGTDGYVAVPYDFDFSGCVAANYTGMEDYELRYYRGLCWDDEQREFCRKQFLTLIPAWEAMIDSFERLPLADRKAMKKYLKPFFQLAEDPKAWAKAFPAVCP